MAKSLISVDPSNIIPCSTYPPRFIAFVARNCEHTYKYILQDMLDGIRQKAVFSFEEYQTMLNLQCGVVTADGEAGIAKALDRNYGMYMIELHGLEIGS